MGMMRKTRMRLGIILTVFLTACFSDIHADTGLILPDGMITVQEEAFCGDSSLEEVLLPEGITRIERLGFAMSSVQKINLPASLSYIADDVFQGCNLKEIAAKKGTYAYQWCREHGFITEYRALLIGEETFSYDPGNTRNRSDVNNMAAMLGRIRGPKGGSYAVDKRYDRTYDEIRKDIRDCLGEAREQDVSLFFISTHGNSSGDGELVMPDFSEKEYLPFSTLASWLTTYVQGEVIVIIQSCGSGSAIYDGSEDKAGSKQPQKKEETPFDPDTFIEAAIKAFEKADPGLLRSVETNDREKSTGDLKIPKYYVLTAASHHELSFGMDCPEDSLSFNYFPKWLIEGIGIKGQSPADVSPKDGTLTLEELYQYVKQYDSTPMEWQDQAGIWHTDYQHVQRYPEGSRYEMFVFE